MSAPITFVLSSVASGSGVYTGTFPGGANSLYAGMWVVISGFTNPANNGTFQVTASSTTTLTTTNSGSVSETAAAKATDFTSYSSLDPSGFPSKVISAATGTGTQWSSRFALLAPAWRSRHLWLQLGNTVGTFSAFVVSLLQSFDGGLTWQTLEGNIDLYNSPAQAVSPDPSPGAILMLKVTTFTGGTSADVIASSN